MRKPPKNRSVSTLAMESGSDRDADNRPLYPPICSTVTTESGSIREDDTGLMYPLICSTVTTESGSDRDADNRPFYPPICSTVTTELNVESDSVFNDIKRRSSAIDHSYFVRESPRCLKRKLDKFVERYSGARKSLKLE